MTARLDLASLLELTLQSAVEILSGQAGLITLRHEDGKFAPFASIGLPRQAVPLFEPLWRDLDANKKKEENSLNDIALRLALASRAAGMVLRQVVALPLEIGEDIIGYIFIFRTYGVAFSDNDQHVLSSFAHQAAIAVHNAQLYQALSAEHARLNAIIENSGDGVMIINPYRIIQTWNRALANLTGISTDDALGRPCYEVLNLRTNQGVSVCHTQCPLIRPPVDGRLFAEGMHQRADGMLISLANHYSPQKNDDSKITQVIANVRDVTHFHEAEQLKQTLLSVISHELKTPVSIIKGYAGTLAREDANWDKATLAEGLAVIEEEADRLDKQINNLLEASRLQAGGFKLRLGYLDLAQVTRLAVQNLHATTTKHTFEVDFPLDYPAVLGDYERLREVITNLIGNAIKYSPEGGIIKVSGQYDRQKKLVYLTVSDQGIGIAPTDQEHVFDRFYRVDNRLARQTPGTGLGLFLVREMVKAHGGRVWVESASGKGSVFTIELPVGLDEQWLLTYSKKITN